MSSPDKLKIGPNGVPIIEHQEPVRVSGVASVSGRVISTPIRGEIQNGKLIMTVTEALDMINHLSAVCMIENVRRSS